VHSRRRIGPRLFRLCRHWLLWLRLLSTMLLQMHVVLGRLAPPPKELDRVYPRFWRTLPYPPLHNASIMVYINPPPEAAESRLFEVTRELPFLVVLVKGETP
jgi:hypothetical protein